MLSQARLDNKRRFDQNWMNAAWKHLKPFREAHSKGSLRSLYFGGGTPSLLDIKILREFLQRIRSDFLFEEDIEISLEANPEDIELQKLLEWKELGINRLSIGVQSFNRQELKRIERLSSQDKLEEALALVSTYFHNFNVDLMLGIPEQNSISLEESLKRVLAFQPPHISIYLLTLSSDHKWFKSPKIRTFLADEGLCREFYLLTCRTLSENSYLHYEVSNFSKPGFQSRHNSNYWDVSSSYMGIGPGAHAYFAKPSPVRYENLKNFDSWLNSDDGLQDKEELSAMQQEIEKLYLSLRTRKPVPLEYLKLDVVSVMERQSLCEITKDGMLLSEEAWLMLDSIAPRVLKCL